MKKKAAVAVTARAFSQHPILRDELQARYEKVKFNDQGVRYSGDALIQYLRGYDCAIVSLEHFDDAVLRALPELKVLSKFGVGLDGIDQAAVKRHGKKLAFAPGVNALSVAELTVSFMLGLMRNSFQASYCLKQGKWQKEGGHQLTGKTIGIVGLGNISKEIIRLLEPFRCAILVHDVVDVSKFCEQHSVRQVDFLTLAKQADILSLHVPLTEKTRYMVNARIFEQMKSTAFLINTARGGIVDESALKQALISRKISGAAIDVYETEPPTDLELLSLPNLICTPHIGGNAYEAVLAMGRAAIEGLEV